MRRGLLILALGLVGAAMAFLGFYRLGTAAPRAWVKSAQPELAWLKHEFNLGDAEFARVTQLHEEYLPRCQERCQEIDRLDDTLSAALAAATEVTPEIEGLLRARAQVRAACQAEMLKHFFEVSRTMAPDQGKRYLAWVRENTCLMEQAMDHGPQATHSTPAPAHRPQAE